MIAGAGGATTNSRLLRATPRGCRLFRAGVFEKFKDPHVFHIKHFLISSIFYIKRGYKCPPREGSTLPDARLQARNVATFEENIKITIQKTLKSRQERDITFYTPYNPRRIWQLFKENIRNTLQKTLEARQEKDITLYTPYNPRRIWPLLKKTLKIYYKKH